jgi:hypothetical protein
MHKAVVTALGHINERWRKELEKPSSFSGIVTGNVETHDHTNAECRKPKCRNECKIPWNQSNGAGEFEQDWRATVARRSVTARNH